MAQVSIFMIIDNGYVLKKCQKLKKSEIRNQEFENPWKLEWFIFLRIIFLNGIQ